MVARKNSTNTEIKTYIRRKRRMTRSQSKGKGKFLDILEAIEIEESPIQIEKIPIVQPIDIKEEETKKKSKRAKKLDFSQEDLGFIFKPRNPITRSQKPKENMLELPLVENMPKMPLEEKMPEVTQAKTKPMKKRKGKEPVKEKNEVEVLQEQLRDALK